MSGEGYALLAAIAYGLAGVTIVKGKAVSRFDNGLFLSVLTTTVLTGLLWLGWGQIPVRAVLRPENFLSIVIFAIAGLFSTVLGRMMMYRATEAVGPVVTSFLRRLTPVFALPLAFLLLGEVPTPLVLTGAAIIVGAVVINIGFPTGVGQLTANSGLMLGVGSAVFYATAYTLRSYGLDRLPDAALGTFIGGLSGALWFAGRELLRSGRLTDLLADRGPWHCLTALALSVGQLFQFLALKSASVVAVATLGTLEVFFSAIFGTVLIQTRGVLTVRLLMAGGLAAAGTLLVVW